MGVITDFLAETTSIDVARPITALDRRVLRELKALGDFDAPAGFEGRHGYAILKIVSAIVLDAPPMTGFPPGLLPKPEDRPTLSPDTLKTIACSIGVTEDNSQVEADLLVSMGFIDAIACAPIKISRDPIEAAADNVLAAVTTASLPPEFEEDILFRWKFEGNTLEEGGAAMIEENPPMVYLDGHVGAQAIESDKNANKMVSSLVDIVPAGDFSINLWCKQPGITGSGKYFIRALETLSFRRFEIVAFDNQFQFIIGGENGPGGPDATKFVSSGSCCSAAGDYHLVQVYQDIGAGKIAIRVRNGTSVGQDTGWITANTSILIKQNVSSATRPLLIGGTVSGNVQQFSVIDEITIYDKRLPDSVFDDLWNGGAGVVF